MKLTQKDVNLALGVLSLIIISYFFIFNYNPSYKEYKEKVAEVNRLDTYYKNAMVISQSIPELEKQLEKYRTRKQQLLSAIPDKVNTSEILTTIEYIAEETKVKMPMFSPLGSTSTPTTPSTTPTTPSTTPSTTPTTPQDTTTQQPTNMSQIPNTFSIKIKGEYRSIMMFMFKIQNLKLISNVSNFKITYNADTDKSEGYPLEATLNISFYDKTGGGIQ